MTSEAVTTHISPDSEERRIPYAPSWVDRITSWVEQLPAASWVYYAGLAIVLILIQSAIQWQAGIYPVGTFSALHIYLACVVPYFLALVHYLDKTAKNAWAEFQPALDSTQAEGSQPEYELTTLSARRALLVGLAGGVIAVISLLSSGPLVEQLQTANMSTSAPSFVFNGILYLLNWCVTSTAIYHVFHQLAVVSRIYQHTRVDVYQLGPIYAFSGLSARTAVGLAIVMYLPAYISRGFDIFAIWTIVRVFVAAIVALTFVWPLLGIHSLLAKEKQRMLGESARHLKTTYRELHQAIENKESAGIESISKAIEGLVSEQKTLRAVSTWPWQPETPRAVLAAILIPVVIWLIQWVLQRVLGT